jgi:uncharacterized protein YhhL (DUF1145 family)
MGAMVHLQNSAPSASKIAIGLAIFGVIAVIVDYVRMLVLRSKMVRRSPHSLSLLFSVRIFIVTVLLSLAHIVSSSHLALFRGRL